VTYHRVFWLLPVPLCVAVAGAGAFARLRVRFPPTLALLLTAAVVSAFYVIAVDRLVLSEANDATLVYPPALKLPPAALAGAQAFCVWAPRGTHVLTPLAVAQQLPVLHGCGYPLMAGDRWLNASAQDRQTRSAVTSIVDSRTDITKERSSWFLEQLKHYQIDAVFLDKEAARNARTKSLLRLADFERVAEVDWNAISVRTRSTTSAQYDLVARAVCKGAGNTESVLAPFGVARALDARHCVRNLSSPAHFPQASVDDADEVLRLERLTFSATDLRSPDQSWLRAALDTRSVSLVVLGPATARSRRVRTVLVDLGFQRVRVTEGHQLWRRALPSSPQ
jgi:hypothetical protein